jgi:hypothetical protein
MRAWRGLTASNDEREVVKRARNDRVSKGDRKRREAAAGDGHRAAQVAAVDVDQNAARVGPGRWGDAAERRLRSVLKRQGGVTLRRELLAVDRDGDR